MRRRFPSQKRDRYTSMRFRRRRTVHSPKPLANLRERLLEDFRSRAPIQGAVPLGIHRGWRQRIDVGMSVHVFHMYQGMFSGARHAGSSGSRGSLIFFSCATACAKNAPRADLGGPQFA
jgi:hypothetical protein